MGIRLVLSVLGVGRELTRNELLVLTTMAATALDTPNAKGQPERLYFGGNEHLAINLGWDPKGKHTMSRVSEITRALRLKGLIEPMVAYPNPHQRQSWRIKVGSPDEGYHQVAPSGDTKVAPTRDITGSPVEGYPRKTQDESGHTSKDSTQGRNHVARRSNARCQASR